MIPSTSPKAFNKDGDEMFLCSCIDPEAPVSHTCIHSAVLRENVWITGNTDTHIMNNLLYVSSLNIVSVRVWPDALMLINIHMHYWSLHISLPHTHTHTHIRDLAVL